MGVAITFVVVFAMFGLLAWLEHTRPVRTFDHVPGWRLKCLIFAPVLVLTAAVVPYVMAPVVEGIALLPGRELGIAGGAIVGIVVSELVVYWAHRLHHRLQLLWQYVHQIHHSAERVDVFGAAYFHPIEIAEGSVFGVLIFNVVLGLAPEAAFFATAWQAFAGVFQHGNIRTPTWLGYIIQRPEAHAIHHERGVHDFNYANLPIWDIVFGTFRNPVAWQGEAGFYPGASKRTFDMLIGRDISGGAPVQ